MQAQAEAVVDSLTRLEPPPPLHAEYAACEITSVEDVRDLFVPHFYFGCEADDPLTAWAFNERTNPLGARLRAMFSSDMGHWDVPDMKHILPEAYELVENEILDEGDFEEFVLTNPVRFYTSLNPDFFTGTRVEQEAARIVQEESKP